MRLSNRNSSTTLETWGLNNKDMVKIEIKPLKLNVTGNAKSVMDNETTQRTDL